ncbi:MAG TPA: hypothetical protein VIL77_15310 [Gaiellaceae bacterium]
MRHAALTVLVVALGAVTAPGLANAASGPPIARPNPGFVSIQLDYVNALRSSSGGVASLDPLDPSVIAQAVADLKFLAYLQRDDLGGFAPAPIGQQAMSSGGHDVVGNAGGQSQIPQFDEAASGTVQAFAFVGQPTTTTPDQGRQPVPGLGIPPVTPPPTNSNTTPLPNQGFGGRPPTSTTVSTTTTELGTTTNRPPRTTTEPTTTTTRTTTPTTTTVPTTTTTPTTTTVPTTTTTQGGGAPPPPPPASCGTIGLSIQSNLAGCRIYAINMAPGDAAFEVMTVKNEADVPFTLSLQASGTPNRLWDDLQMGVWEVGTPAPSPLPALLWWTLQENQLTTLQPGDTVSFHIEIALPATAGNADQGYGASIDFHWHAQG